MSTITNVTSTTQVPVNSTTGTTVGTTSTSTTGSGTVGQTGDIPPVQGGTATYDMILSSLRSFTSNMSSADLSVLISEIAESLRDIQQLSDNDKVTVETNDKRAKIAEKREKLEEAIKKLKEAEAAMGSGNIFAILKAIFSILLAILTFSAGLAVNPMMLMASAYFAMDAKKTIESALGKTDAMGLGGTLAKMFGASDEDAKSVDMGVEMMMMVAQVAASIALTALSGGAGGGALAVQIAKAAELAMSIVSAVIDLGSAGSNMAASIIQSDATKAKADTKKLEAIMEMIDQIIDEAIARMLAAGDRFNDIIDNTMDALNDRSNTLSKASFTG